jgi:hypothetical protein
MPGAKDTLQTGRPGGSGCLDASPVPFRGSLFLEGSRTRSCKAIDAVVSRSNSIEPLRTEIAAVNFKLRDAVNPCFPRRRTSGLARRRRRMMSDSSPLVVRDAPNNGHINKAPKRRLPRRPGEFHPEPLTEPDLSLSTYPARGMLAVGYDVGRCRDAKSHQRPLCALA